jgi:hypothetical protein
MVPRVPVAAGDYRDAMPLGERNVMIEDRDDRIACRDRKSTAGEETRCTSTIRSASFALNSRFMWFSKVKYQCAQFDTIAGRQLERDGLFSDVEVLEIYPIARLGALRRFAREVASASCACHCRTNRRRRVITFPRRADRELHDVGRRCVWPNSSGVSVASAVVSKPISAGSHARRR